MAELHAAGAARVLGQQVGAGRGGRRRALAAGLAGQLAVQQAAVAVAGAGQLGGQRGALAELVFARHRAHAEGLAGIFVAHVDAAHAQFLGRLDLSVGAIDREGLAAGVDFVAHADRVGVQIRVEAGDRRLEQQPAGPGFELIVHEALPGLAAQDQGRLIAVARQHHHLFAVQVQIAMAQLERAGGAVGGEFLDHLAQRVVRGEAGHFHSVALDVRLVVALDAVERA